MRLLLVEDDAGLRDVLRRGLLEEGYVVDAAGDAGEALSYLAVYEYGLCVCDWRLPDQSGIEVLTWARRRQLPTAFLMLTARDATADRVQALDAGADDYLVKPFEYPELLARLRALLRRPGGDRAPQLRCGDLILDPATRDVRGPDGSIPVTSREFALLELLFRRSPAVVTRRAIATQAWPDEAEAVGSNTIEVHIARIRAKLARSAARIETVRGTGYRLVSE
ncbi:MAG: two-component system response regulator [Acidimicrobiaceae bacterium]|nr:two-component system response regulator [Acidimicrobiaceae bacterium]